MNEYFVAHRKLAEKCYFGQLLKEMICDTNVGLLGQALSERLELDPYLTLKKVIDVARNTETVKLPQ